MRTINYAAAISEGLVQCMETDQSVFIMGIGVTHSQGVFGTTNEANRLFGPKRVIETPNSENAMTGFAIGAAAVGKRPVIVHARNDFMFLAFDQMINVAAKWAYMYGGTAGNVPIVVRGIIGKGWGQGATHSQSLQSVLGHFPGLQVVMPATPADAKGLLVSALRSSAPTVILEHRALFEAQGVVPKDLIPVPIGKAAIVKTGTDITIAATSMMVVEAVRAAKGLEAVGISAEVVDIRSIRPIDRETIVHSVRKTGHVVIADTSWVTYGVAAEIAAIVSEEAFDALKAPVRRLGMAEVPAPVSFPLEDAFYSDANDVAKACLDVLGCAATEVTIPVDMGPEFLGPY